MCFVTNRNMSFHKKAIILIIYSIFNNISALVQGLIWFYFISHTVVLLSRFFLSVKTKRFTWKVIKKLECKMFTSTACQLFDDNGVCFRTTFFSLDIKQAGPLLSCYLASHLLSKLPCSHWKALEIITDIQCSITTTDFIPTVFHLKFTIYSNM